jgi:hypothetical protein
MHIYSALLDRMLNQWGIKITIIMSFPIVVMIYQEKFAQCKDAPDLKVN